MLVSVNRFADAVCRIVPDCTVYLTGSAAVGDYRHGWSDIDMLFLTSASLSEKAATSLVNLRQAYGDDPYIPKIEGGVVPFCAFLRGEKLPLSTGERPDSGSRKDTLPTASRLLRRKTGFSCAVRMCGTGFRSRRRMHCTAV